MAKPDQTSLGNLALLPLAVFAVSWGSIFIRFAETPALITAFYRMAFAVAILTLWAVGPGRKPLRRPNRQSRGLCVLSGFFLALHFAFWISSLDTTPVANSVLLVSAGPIFAAIIGQFVLKEKPRPQAYPAIFLALSGGALIMGGDLQWAPGQLRGDIYALIGAAMVGAYFVLGRLAQRKIGVFAYIYLTYSSAAFFLAVIALFSGDTFVGYPATTWGWLFLLGLVPTVIGHSLYNRLLRFFKAHVVGACTLGEPIGATILAIIFLAESPPWYAMLGALPIFAGVLWVFQLERGR